MARIYPDRSVTEVKIAILNIRDNYHLLRDKSVNNPFNEKDYQTFYRYLDLIDSIAGSRWIKDYY